MLGTDCTYNPTFPSSDTFTCFTPPGHFLALISNSIYYGTFPSTVLSFSVPQSLLPCLLFSLSLVLSMYISLYTHFTSFHLDFFLFPSVFSHTFVILLNSISPSSHSSIIFLFSLNSYHNIIFLKHLFLQSLITYSFSLSSSP